MSPRITRLMLFLLTGLLSSSLWSQRVVKNKTGLEFKWEVLHPATTDGQMLDVGTDEEMLVWCQLTDETGAAMPFEYSGMELLGQFEIGKPIQVVKLIPVPGSETGLYRLRLSDLSDKVYGMDLPSYGRQIMPQTIWMLHIMDPTYTDPDGQQATFPNSRDTYFRFTNH